MSTEQTPPQQEWGAAPDRPAAKWSTRKTVAAVAIAVGVAGAGGAAIYAASGTDASASQGGMGQGGPGGQGQGGGQSALLNALHGEYVVSDSNGGYTTELMQIGTVRTGHGPSPGHSSFISRETMKVSLWKNAFPL